MNLSHTPPISQAAPATALTLKLLVVAAVLFGVMANDVVQGGPLSLLDGRIAAWLHAHSSVALTTTMFIITQLHSTFTIAGLATVAAGLAAWRRRWGRMATLSVIVGGGLLLNVLLKHAFRRARPIFDDPILTLDTFSFPSGHVAGSTVFYALGVGWVFAQTTQLRWRLLAVLGAALIVTLVAFSRMALGVHYLSDVVAAFAEGVFWVTLCVSARAVFIRLPEKLT